MNADELGPWCEHFSDPLGNADFRKDLSRAVRRGLMKGFSERLGRIKAERRTGQLADFVIDEVFEMVTKGYLK